MHLYNGRQIFKKSETNKVINKIRGKGLVEITISLITILLMCRVIRVVVQGFVTDNPNYEWRDRPNSR